MPAPIDAGTLNVAQPHDDERDHQDGCEAEQEGLIHVWGERNPSEVRAHEYAHSDKGAKHETECLSLIHI